MTTDNEDAFRGSAVLRARTVIDREALLDELEFRLTRCAASTNSPNPGLRMGGFLAAGELAHRVARNETRSFWNEHRLGQCSRETLEDFVDGLFERPARYLAWCLVPLFAELAAELFMPELTDDIIDWVTTGEPVERVVRDAVTVTLVSKALASMAQGEAIERLVALCDSDVPDRIRMGAIGLAAFVRQTSVLGEPESRRAYLACFRVASRVDSETAIAVGWAIRELLGRSLDQLMGPFETHLHCLSRQAFRTAVERLPQATRARLSARWLEARKVRAHGGSVSPRSSVRSRGFNAK